MTPALTIAKREFRSYFDSPLAYVVICLSLLMLGVRVFIWNEFWQVDRATLASMFEAIPSASPSSSCRSSRCASSPRRSAPARWRCSSRCRCGTATSSSASSWARSGWCWCSSCRRWSTRSSCSASSGTSGRSTMGPFLAATSGSCSSARRRFARPARLEPSPRARSSRSSSPSSSWWRCSSWASCRRHVPNVLGTVFREISFMEHFMPFERGLIDTRDVVFFVSFAVLGAHLRLPRARAQEVGLRQPWNAVRKQPRRRASTSSSSRPSSSSPTSSPSSASTSAWT